MYKKSWTLEGVLFALILAIESIQILSVIFFPRLVLHDSLFRFTLQYFFLNNAVMDGEIPQWISFLTHGSPASSYHCLQGVTGLLAYAYFLIGPLLQKVNFIDLFYTGILFDKFILLIGAWLYSRRLFVSKYTSLFVVASIGASAIWGSQIFFNLHLYYALPFIFYLVHTFLDTQKWRYLFLAVNLYALQLLGNAAYFIPITLLAIFVYFLSYCILFWKDTCSNLRKLKWNRYSFLCLVSIGLSVLSIFIIIFYALDASFHLNYTYRNPDGSLTVNTFLENAALVNDAQWLELILGISPMRDYTLYGGIIIVPMVILGLLFNLKKKIIPLIILCLTFIMLSKGGEGAVFLYKHWPMMDFFRHLHLLLPLTKLFLFFIAGAGIDYLFVRSDLLSRRKVVWVGSFFIIFLLAGAIYLYTISFQPSILAKLFLFMGYESIDEHSKYMPVVAASVRASGYKLCFVALVLPIFYIFKKAYWLKYLIPTLFILHLSDVYFYSYAEMNSRTVPLNRAQVKILEFQHIPFNKRRLTFKENNTRKKLFTKKVYSRSAFYWTHNAFLFNDEIGFSFRTDKWLQPLEDFMRSFGQIQVKENFPLKFPAAQKYSAWTKDKIQFFSYAYVVSQNNGIPKVLADPHFKGDMLFIETKKNTFDETASAQIGGYTQNLELNHRLELPYYVKHFSANRLDIEVINPYDHDIWLFYSDVYHPMWKAKINQKPARLYKANLAYKAIALNPGANFVQFSFFSKILGWTFKLIGINVIFWIIYIFYIIYKMRKKL